jgi:hypothetical protein
VSHPSTDAAPRAWSVLTLAVLGFSVVHLVVNLVAAILRELHRQAVGEAMAGTMAAIGRIGSLDSGIAALDLTLLWLMRLGLWVLIAWAVVVRQLLRRHGADPKLMNHRVVTVAVLLGLAQWALNWRTIQTVADTYYQVVSDSGRGVDLTQIVAGAMRMTMAVLIAFWVWTVRGRVLAVIAGEPGGGHHAGEPGDGRRNRNRQNRAYREV